MLLLPKEFYKHLVHEVLNILIGVVILIHTISWGGSVSLKLIIVSTEVISSMVA